MAFSREQAEKLLTVSFAEGRMAHAYLISGPPGSGKAELTLDLLAGLGEKRSRSLEAARSELVQVLRPESRSRRIRVEAIRAMERRLHLAVPEGVTKVAILMDADRLMPEAANAFLKTLEEPPAKSILFLLTSAPEQLLDTTRSRCISISLRPTGVRQVSAAQARLLEVLEKHFAAGAVGGRAFAWTLLQRFVAILREEKEAIAKHYAEVLKGEREAYGKVTEGDWLKRREENLKALTESDYLEQRSALIQVLMDWLGDALRMQTGSGALDLPDYRTGTAALGGHYTVDELLRRFESLDRLRAHLGTNVQEALALEAGFLAAFG